MTENGRLQCCACLANIKTEKEAYPLDTPRVWNIFKDCTRIAEDVPLTGNQNLCAECYNTCTKWVNFYNMCKLNIPQTTNPRPPLNISDIISFPEDGKQRKQSTRLITYPPKPPVGNPVAEGRNASVQALEDLSSGVQENKSILLDGVMPMLTFVAKQLGYGEEEKEDSVWPGVAEEIFLQQSSVPVQTKPVTIVVEDKSLDPHPRPTKVPSKSLQKERERHRREKKRVRDSSNSSSDSDRWPSPPPPPPSKKPQFHFPIQTMAELTRLDVGIRKDERVQKILNTKLEKLQPSKLFKLISYEVMDHFSLSGRIPRGKLDERPTFVYIANAWSDRTVSGRQAVLASIDEIVKRARAAKSVAATPSALRKTAAYREREGRERDRGASGGGSDSVL